MFDWVLGECELDIQQQTAAAQATTSDSEEGELDNFDIDIIEQTFFNFKQKGDDFARKFYETLFSDFPQVKSLFDGTSIDE